MNTKPLWDSLDRTMDEADKLFEQADRFFEEAKRANSKVHIDSPDEHKVRFRSDGMRERCKLAWNFFCLTASMVFRGHATVIFRRRKPIK